MKWIMEDDDELRCSNCDYPISVRYTSDESGNKVVKAPAYCPNCKEEIEGNEYIKLVYENKDKTGVDQSPKSIFVVTYWNTGEEPTVTAFDNQEAAKACFNYFNDIDVNCCLDETHLYSTFNVH